MELYHQNYIRLLQLPDLHEMTGPAKLTAVGHTDVHVDVIERHPHRLVLRMSHYLQRLHGAAISDPDMTVEVYMLAETVGVLTYCDCRMGSGFSLVRHKLQTLHIYEAPRF